MQHKQIRRHDLLDQDSLQDSFGGGNYQRHPSLPPSGPSANQHLWFDTAGGTEDGDDPEEQHRLHDGDELDDPSPPNEVNENDDLREEVSPLSNLGQLQSALPEIPAAGSKE